MMTLASGVKKLFALAALLRIHHWIKNCLVAIPLFFSGRFFHLRELAGAAGAFLAFSAMSSAVYIFNDIRDIAGDRVHPEKRKRPLPSGAVSVRTAWVCFAVLMLFSILASLTLFPLCALLVLLIYFGLNLGYSIGLKNIPVIDFSILASGFVLRIFYGGACCHVRISHWLFLCALTASLFMGIGKRRNELRRVGSDRGTRKVLTMYSEGFLDKSMYLSATLALVFYSLWATSPAAVNPLMIYTVPVVLLLFFRYSLLIESKSSSGDPVNVLYGDRVLQSIAALYALILLFLYLYRTPAE